MLRRAFSGAIAGAATFATALMLVTATAAPAAGGTAGHAAGSRAHAGAVTHTGPITDVSSRCPGQNAEVEQATWHSDVYVAWIGCGGIGFSRSFDGGRTWSAPAEMAGSANGWDPAVAVAPDGTLYVSFMNSTKTHSFPVVDTSFDHGLTFARPSRLVPPHKKNWGDRDFIAAGPHGVVYLTWDYGPSAAKVTTTCPPSGSCAFATGDLNVVIQKSTDYGRTWGPITHVSPGFPASGGDSAPMVVQPDGRIDLEYQGYDIYNRTTYAMKPAHTYFTSSDDGGQTWSRPVRVGASAGTMSLAEWWIDGAIGRDAAGDLYITWDTQNKSGGTKTDTGWLSYSTDQGRSWSAPVRATPDTDDAAHIVQVLGGAGDTAYVGWLSDSSPHGYAQYLRAFSLRRGWLSGPERISRRYGDPSVWPGDTFGISGGGTSAGGGIPAGPCRHGLVLSWGGAVSGSRHSEIFAAPVTVSPGVTSG
ncbi:MAG: exo-alpha-sialidase [Nocardiopsaceae bacterium]|nr:exo-alpha-sialidase [Nocardiopsaceae bacterium]